MDGLTGLQAPVHSQLALLLWDLWPGSALWWECWWSPAAPVAARRRKETGTPESPLEGIPRTWDLPKALLEVPTSPQYTAGNHPFSTRAFGGHSSPQIQWGAAGEGKCVFVHSSNHA